VCDSKSVSVCSWLECECVTCTVLCERESVCVCECVCVSGVWTVHCVGYGEIVWYMLLNVFVCHNKSVSVCVCVVG
jgi:hypothetical protein